MLRKKLRKWAKDPANLWWSSPVGRRMPLPRPNRDVQRDRPVALMWGFSPWKYEFVQRCFPDFEMIFVPQQRVVRYLRTQIDGKPVSYVVWGYNEFPKVTQFAEDNGIPLSRMEDGFLRSTGLGATHALPRSLVLDKTGRLYFDAGAPSGLERLCAEYDFDADPKLLGRARAGMDQLLSMGLSKYNLVQDAPEPASVFEGLAPNSKGNRILVVGQVEDDASIRLGRAEGLNNFEAVRIAREENPNAPLFYRPHPDDLAGRTKAEAFQSRLDEIAKLAHIVTSPMSLPDALGNVDRIYTITSLVGFEALMRGLSVTVLGYPFYAGWGLTDDRQSDPRRTRKLSIEQLFAAAYLLYPSYFDPATGQPSTLEATIEAIVRERSAVNPSDCGAGA